VAGGSDLELTPEQVAVARCLMLVELNLVPKCRECGYLADRPNCAAGLGGHCQRHTQEDVVAYEQVHRSMLQLMGRVPWGWKYHVPLHLLHSFTATERELLLDLAERGGQQETRSHDDRYQTLSRKGAVQVSSQYSKWRVQLSQRGQALAELWLAEERAAEQAAPAE